VLCFCWCDWKYFLCLKMIQVGAIVRYSIIATFIKNVKDQVTQFYSGVNLYHEFCLFCGLAIAVW
jgi:hypothetical protein